MPPPPLRKAFRPLKPKLYAPAWKNTNLVCKSMENNCGKTLYSQSTDAILVL